jgi:hypothetical protein
MENAAGSWRRCALSSAPMTAALRVPPSLPPHAVSPRLALLTLVVAFVTTSAACGNASAPDAGAPTDAAAAAVDAEVAPDVDSTPDAEPVDVGPPPPPDVCDRLGLTRVPFTTDGLGDVWSDRAGDFTITDLDGSNWSLRDAWTGCETYTFVNYVPTTGSEEEQLFGSDVMPLVVDVPESAHVFFTSWEDDEVARRARLEPVVRRVETALVAAFPDEEERARHRARFHFVAEDGEQIPGSVGALVAEWQRWRRTPQAVVDLGDRGRAGAPTPFVFAIDRDQRWDAGGSMSEFVGGRSSLRMASYLPLFFDHKARVRDAVAAGGDVVRIPLVGGSTTARVFRRDVRLPSGAALRGYDGLEAHVRVTCRERNVFACSEWDRIAWVHLCEDAACNTRRELLRWVTPYWRVGEQRWLMDASPMLPLLGDGGTKNLRVELGPEWERPTPWDVELELRLVKRGGERAVGSAPAFVGGTFDASYNTREPVRFTPPSSARRVELVLLLSGHGQDGNTNCAEWCDHRHTFTLNGTMLPVVRHEGRVGSPGGCGPAAARGAPPGQFGNWAPERAYWCPGAQVEPIRIDLTSQIRPGAENELTYRAGLGAGAPGGGDIALSSYVVWYE